MTNNIFIIHLFTKYFNKNIHKNKPYTPKTLSYKNTNFNYLIIF